LFHIIIAFVKNYRAFFIVIVAIIVFIGAILWFFNNASSPERGYEFTEKEGTDNTEPITGSNR
jgi:hypothetical protein